MSTFSSLGSVSISFQHRINFTGLASPFVPYALIILSWRLIMNISVILSLPLIQKGQLSVSGERMCTVLVNRLED